MSVIEFTGIHVLANDASALAGYGLESPIPRSKHRGGGVEFKGWVLSGRRKVTAVEVRGSGEPRRLPLGQPRPDIAAHYPGMATGNDGFLGIVDFEGPDDLLALTVVAVLDDGSEVRLAAAAGRRLRAPALPRPEPSDAGDDPSTLVAPADEAVPRASVVIPVHNQSALTRACLEAILAPGNVGLPFEVVVVDDASGDDTPALLGEYGGRIQAVRLAANVGFGRACNAGAALARGEFVVFLNNDTDPLPGWLDALVADADAHPAAAAVGARLLFPDGFVQHAGVAIGPDGYPHHLYAGFPHDHPAVLRSRPMRLVTAACLLVRTDRFRDLAGFDPAYQNGWEDADFCLRLGEAGHGVRYCADSVVVHHESASRNPHGEREHRNRARWTERWHGRTEPDCFRYWLEDGLLAVDPMGPLYPQRIGYAREAAVTEPLARGNPTPRRPATASGDASDPHPILGRIESPSSNPGLVSGPTLPVFGWALSKAGIAAVETFVDGHPLGQVEYGLARPDVVALHPEFADAEDCGFSGGVPVLYLAEGDHRLEIRIATHDGRVSRLGAPFRTEAASFARGAVTLRFDRPAPGEVANPAVGLFAAGWAVSPYGIARVEATIDGEPAGLLDHGSSRPDVARLYPFYPDAERSGFLGVLPVAHLAPGSHRLTVRAVAPSGQENEAEVTFAVDGAG